MTYGPHSALVEEIVAFAESGPLLRRAAPIVGDVHVVTDFDEAREYAYRRYLTEADDALNWTDLREREAGEIHAVSGELGPALNGLWERMLAAVSPRLPEAYADLLDDVLADLVNAASTRAVFGAGDRLFDRVWDAYKQGGWPCGWEGEYPAGRLVVHQPSL